MTRFETHAVSGTWGGSVAATDADTQDVLRLMRHHDLMAADDCIVGLDASFGDGLGPELPEPNVQVLIATATDYARHLAQPDAVPLALRQVGMQLRPAEFLQLFKRLGVTLRRPHTGVPASDPSPRA